MPGFIPIFEQKIQGHFKDFQGHISHFQGLNSVQKRAFSLCLFEFFHNMSNFILKVFLSLLSCIKLALQFKV